MSEPASAPPIETVPRPLRSWFWIAFIALALAKLLLVSRDEIVLYTDDDQSFAYSAGGWYWGRPYSAYSHARQPVYPLFVAASSALGLPLRISIELVWIGACAWSATALRRCGGRSLLVLAACGLILFHPWLFNLNCRMLADTLYTPLLLVFVTGSAAALLERSWRAMLSWAGPAAIAAALAANTRQESILILGSIAVTAVVALALGLLKCADRATTLRRGLTAAGLPLIATIALTHGFRAANYASIGVYSSYDLESPGYRALYTALLAIPPEKHDLRLPVPRDVREKAYAASPAFATLRHALEEDKRLHDYARACERQTGAKGEYGAWTCWAIRQAVWVSREHKVATAREVDDLFATAAREIRAAMRDGRLEHRAVPMGLLPPEWALLIGQLPASSRAAWEMLVGSTMNPIRSEKLPPKQAALFENTALRRTALAMIVDGKEPPVSRDLWHGPEWSAELDSVKKALGDAQPWLVRVQAVLVPMALLLGLIGFRRGWVQHRWYVLMILLGTALAARVTLVVLLDATGIDAQRRYLLPAGVLAIIISLFTIQAMVAMIASLLRRSPRPDIATPRLQPVRGGDMAAAGNPLATSSSSGPATSPASDGRARLIFLAIWLVWGLALLWARASYPGLEIGEDWADADILSAARWYDAHGHRGTGSLPRLETAPPPPGEPLALYDTYPPGPFWIHESLRAIGLTGLAGLRVASQIFAHLGVLAFYFVFRRLSSSPWIALAGASIYMLSAPYASYSSGFWMNLGQPMLAFLLLAWLRLEDARDTPTRRWRLLALCGLAFLDFWITLENALFLAAFTFVRAIGGPERRRRFAQLAVVLSTFAAALIVRVLFNAWAEHATVAAAIKDLSDTAAERASAQFGGFSWGTLGSVWAARLGWPFNEPGRTQHHTAFVFPALAPVVLAGVAVLLMVARRTLAAQSSERRGLRAGLLLLACGLTWTALMPNHVYPHWPTVQTVMPGLSLMLGSLACAGLRGVFERRQVGRPTAIVSAAASLALLGGMFAGLARCDLVNRIWPANTRVRQRVMAVTADNDRFARAGPALARFDRLLVHPKRPTMMFLLGVPSTSSAKQPTRPLLPGEGLVLDVWHPGAARYAAERSIDLGLPDTVSFPGRMLAFPADESSTRNIRAGIEGLGQLRGIRIAPTLDPGHIAVMWRLTADPARPFDATLANRFAIGFELIDAAGKPIAKQASRLAWLGTFTDREALIWSSVPEPTFRVAAAIRLTVSDTQTNTLALWTIDGDLPARTSLGADRRWLTIDMPSPDPATIQTKPAAP